MTVKYKNWFSAMGFKKSGNLWIMDIHGHNITINEKENKIVYPEDLVVGRNTTTNFSSEENFVVLNAVVNLIQQGYNPKNIEIEKGYRLGHNKSSGYADITVKDNNDTTFMIIEAKKYGDEFNKAWNKTLVDGGQLFSYEKQENTAQVIVLYTARVKEDRIESIYHAINLIDNDEFLKTLNNPKSYRLARGGNDKYLAWKNTYQLDYLTNGVLEPSIAPYNINKSKSTIHDLNDITHDEIQQKYNDFASILRKYNIGGRENAFDKLVNLFLVKLVDEEQNGQDLQFNWKGVAQDTYFDLVDRLQKLYQVGMEKFLDETVTYVAEEDIANAFRLKKDAAKDAVLDYFKQLKYYSNNDFSFIEVYNEKLFFQNSKVLVEIIKMFQNIKLKSNNQNQFLGDLFEGFLDNGVKQTEGQFFTPIPIVKFIISSLPLDEINSQGKIPKVIDYACGAGHFLNEYADQIKEIIEPGNISDYYKHIYGIEKEYRLSKVAKVASFMYGQDEMRIIYNDALKEQEFIKNDDFSVVIANPPYSVKGFLTTLSDKERENYELLKYVNDIEVNNSIELFFIERTKQLLKKEGVAGIVLPTSLLTNSTKIVTETRKMILENFDIISIVEFGDRAFSSTGTNTITMFLRKKQYPPSLKDHFRYAIERWFNNEDITKEDVEIIKAYLDHILVPYEDYSELLNNQYYNLQKYDVFQQYNNKFKKSMDYKRINKRKVSNKFSQEDKEKALNTAFINYMKEIEREKCYYFSLANSQNQSVVVVKSPSKAQPQKEFLGYDWSNRRGQEGIKYLGVNLSDEEMEVSKNQAIFAIETPLFNPKDLNDTKKINSIIKMNYYNKEIVIPEELNEYVSTIKLPDMLNFNRDFFDAQIKTVIPTVIETQYPNKKLGDLVDIKIGGTPSRANNDFYTNGSNLWVSIREMNGNIIHDTQEKITFEAVKKSNVKIIPAGTTLLSFKLSIGKTAIAGRDLFTNEAIAALVPKSNEVTDNYLFSLFNSKLIDLESVSGKAFGKSLNSDFLNNEIVIPVPPLHIQKNIANDIERYNNQINELKNKILKLEDEKDDIFNTVKKYENDNIGLSSEIFDVSIGSRVVKHELSKVGIPVISANIFKPIGLIEKVFKKDLSQPSVLWSIDNDWQVRIIPANEPFYPTDHAGVISVNQPQKIDFRYLAMALYKKGIIERFDRVNRASIERIKSLYLEVPSIEIQKKIMDNIDILDNKIHKLNSEINKIEKVKKGVVKSYFKME